MTRFLVIVHWYNMKTRHTPEQGADSDQAEHALFTAIAAIRDSAEAKQFFEDLCTPSERQSMADRWRVVEPIMQGIPYRTIYEQTGVSVTTIGRVARCLTHGQNGYNLIYNRIKQTSQTKK